MFKNPQSNNDLVNKLLGKKPVKFKEFPSNREIELKKIEEQLKEARNTRSELNLQNGDFSSIKEELTLHIVKLQQAQAICTNMSDDEFDALFNI